MYGWQPKQKTKAMAKLFLISVMALALVVGCGGTPSTDLPPLTLSTSAGDYMIIPTPECLADLNLVGSVEEEELISDELPFEELRAFISAYDRFLTDCLTESTTTDG